MSKTLEYVKKEIEIILKILEQAKKENYCPAYLEEYESDLHHFQQIKCELEAWNETKKFLVLNEKTLTFYDSTYEYITLKNDCIDESNSEEEGVSIMLIKKALEVEDE